MPNDAEAEELGDGFDGGGEMRAWVGSWEAFLLKDEGSIESGGERELWG